MVPPHCSPVPCPHHPPSALAGGKPSPGPLYAPSQVVFSFLIFSLSPVANGPKPISAEDASVFAFADPMRLYIRFHFHHSHLLQLVPRILYPWHWSVPIADSDEHRSIVLSLTLCLSSLLLACESLSLLPASPASCPWCVRVLRGSGKANVQREEKANLGEGVNFS